MDSICVSRCRVHTSVRLCTVQIREEINTWYVSSTTVLDNMAQIAQVSVGFRAANLPKLPELIDPSSVINQ